MDSGVKHDEGKLPWHLLPYDALEEVVRVLQAGAVEYGDRNWELGMSWSRLFGAAMRHLAQTWWQRRLDRDDKTQLLHLGHAACCVLFLLSYQLRVIGTDDRPNRPNLQKD